MLRHWVKVVTIAPCSYTVLFFPEHQNAACPLSLFPGSTGASRHCTEDHSRHRLSLSRPRHSPAWSGLQHWQQLHSDFWKLQCLYNDYDVFFQDSSSGGIYNNPILGLVDPQVGDLKSIGLPVPLHRYTHTYPIYRHTTHTTHQQPADVVYFTCTQFFQNSKFVDNAL